MTTNTFKEKVLTIARLQREAEDSLDRTLVARFIDFLRTHNTMGMVEINFGKDDDFLASTEMYSEFNIPDSVEAEYLEIVNFCNPAGIVLAEEVAGSYLVVPFEYLENPDNWEDEMLKRTAGIADNATKALKRVFPNLPDTRTTFHVIGTMEGKQIVQIGFPDLEEWTFKYDGVSYGGRYCIGYDMETDNILYLDSAINLGITSRNRVLTRPLTQEEIANPS